MGKEIERKYLVTGMQWKELAEGTLYRQGYLNSQKERVVRARTKGERAALTIKGIYGREMFETWYKMSSLIQSGLDLSPMITHQYNIDDFAQGFDAMRSGQSGKVILNWI